RRRVRAHPAPGSQHHAGPRGGCARAAARARRPPRLRRREDTGGTGQTGRPRGAHSAPRPRGLRPPAGGRCMMADLTMDQASRMRELLARFKLPTVAAEIIKRLTDAGHPDALGTLLEVFEAEADERGQRRTERLLRASRLPADKTFQTLERGRLPRPVLTK